MKQNYFAALFAAVLIAFPSLAEAGGFRGSISSMREQHAVAVERDLAFIRDADEVRELVGKGILEPLEATADFRLVDVSYPYAVPEVKLFIERLASQYREANGVPLVVTSLTRPVSSQPRNAHQLSVHPAGMAVDFRVPPNSKARAWLESVLLQLENRGVLDVTRERYPPHYHVAIFPAAYAEYVKKLPPTPKAEPAPAAKLPEPPAPVVATASEPIEQVVLADASQPPHSFIVLMLSLGAAVLLAMVTKRYATV
jgi:hypothetical protein